MKKMSVYNIDLLYMKKMSLYNRPTINHVLLKHLEFACNTQWR